MPPKLTDKQITAARILRVLGFPNKEIARIFGRAPATMFRLYNPERLESARAFAREKYREEYRARVAKIGLEVRPYVRSCEDEQLMSMLMFLFGARVSDISKITGRSTSVLYRWLSPEQQSTHRIRESARYKKLSPESRMRFKLRIQARIEAAETGRPVKEVYASYGCA